MTLGNPFFQWNRLLYLTGRFDIGFIEIDYIDHQNLTLSWKKFITGITYRHYVMWWSFKTNA